MHKVFVSYHHDNDQWAKEALLFHNYSNGIFIDASVDTGDVDEALPPQRIREIIRDDYLRDSTVTILLVGLETRGRKHVDWEIYSSMYNGTINKQSGIIVVMLPSTECVYWTAAHEEEKAAIYPGHDSWRSISSRTEYERRYPYMPERITDNLLNPKALISVVSWDRFASNAATTRLMIDLAYRDRSKCKYDLSRDMRMVNSPRF